jgi:squalene-hopene/tetraprenyl-beta-curcumene cyclase
MARALLERAPTDGGSETRAPRERLRGNHMLSISATTPASSRRRGALDQAISRAQNALLSLQDPEEGYFWAELEANVSLTAEYVMLHRWLGTHTAAREAEVRAHLLATQGPDGGWPLYHGGPGDLSMTVEAYLALKICGEPADGAPMRRARELVLARGGAGAARVFTLIHLALMGQIGWGDVPAMPAWFVLIPRLKYELSSWARSCFVPLTVLFARKWQHALPAEHRIDELFAPGGRVGPARGGGLGRRAFWYLDRALRRLDALPVAPLEGAALRAAERWILARQDEPGDWAGIYPAMAYSVMALRALGHPLDHPSIRKGLEAIERFGIREGGTFRVQSCVSPVWDTALSLVALGDAGLDPALRAPAAAPPSARWLDRARRWPQPLPVDHRGRNGHCHFEFPVRRDGPHPDLARAARWLLDRQIARPGDWAVKNRRGSPGGWAFEFVNDHYPDVDDTIAVLLALHRVETPFEAKKRGAMDRGLAWVLSMQCRDGGFAAFDVDNDLAILDHMPFADHGAMLDPSCPDITGRVLQLLGELGHGPDHPAAARAIAFLRRRQKEDGSFHGRWGVARVYGTGHALQGLGAMGLGRADPMVDRAVRWLEGAQNADGGWGESVVADVDPSYRGGHPSTASQTAWALLGLVAAGQARSEAARRAAAWLLGAQRPDGGWDEEAFTGTGFPGHFYIRYHLYRLHFPLSALARYRAAIGGAATAAILERTGG